MLVILLYAMCIVITESCEVVSHMNYGKVADCSSRNLTTIPTYLDKDISHLLLRNNKLTNISDINLYPNLTKLDLSFNRITRLQGGQFHNLSKLEILDLRFQPEILTFCENSFPADVFKGLGALKELRLRAVTGECNSPKQTFSWIPNLDRLYIEGYGMAAVNNFIPPLPVEIGLISKLLEFEIIYSRPAHVNSEFLKHVPSTVRVVGMRNTQLVQIDGETFSNMPNLTTVNLAFNEHLGLEQVVKSLAKSSNTVLKSLVLDKVGSDTMVGALTTECWCNSLGYNLERLSVKGNPIPHLASAVFHCLPNLRVFDLSYTSIISVDFTNDPPTMFPQLEIAALNDLWFTGMNYALTYIRCSRIQFAGCDLSTEDFFPHPPDIPQLNSPDVAGTPFYTANTSNKVLPGNHLPKVKYLFGIHDKAFKAMIDPDCIYYFNRSILYMNFSGSLSFREALQTKNVTIAGVKDLRVLDISYIGIRSLGITFESPNLRVFKAANNLLGAREDRHLLTTNLRFSPALEILDISNNRFTNLPRNLSSVLPKLRHLDLSYNRLTLSSLQIALDPYTNMDMEVDVSYNHMVCDCDLLNWLNTTKVTLTGVDTIICALAEKETPLAQLNRTQLCMKLDIPAKMSKTVTIAVTSTALSVAFLFIFGFTIIYKNRRGLLIRYYLWRWHRRREVPLMDGDHMELNQESYDCFVIYDSNNNTTRPWVTIELHEQVQQWGFSLYIKDRHAIGGGTKANEIFDKMYICQCVIIVLTEELFQDEWVDLALHSAMAFSKTWGKKLGKRICIITYDEVDENCIPNQFHALFYPKTFLTGATVLNFTLDDSNKNTKHFWRKLQQFMLKSAPGSAHI